MVVRIMLMVPLYAISSLISLFSVEAAFVIDAIRDIYEASISFSYHPLCPVEYESWNTFQAIELWSGHRRVMELPLTTFLPLGICHLLFLRTITGLSWR